MNADFVGRSPNDAAPPRQVIIEKNQEFLRRDFWIADGDACAGFRNVLHVAFQRFADPGCQKNSVLNLPSRAGAPFLLGHGQLAEGTDARIGTAGARHREFDSKHRALHRAEAGVELPAEGSRHTDWRSGFAERWSERRKPRRQCRASSGTG